MKLSYLMAAAFLTLGCRVEFGPPVGMDPASSPDAPAGEVWIYTSMYQEVIDDLTPTLQQALPQVQVHWYQAGSEKIAQRAEAEWSAGGTKACLLMTSDPFWYADLAEQGRLARHLAPNVLHLDRGLVDVDGYWATARLSLMVLTRNRDRVPDGDAPGSFADLADPRWKDRLTMGDPLSSGTMFTTLAFLEQDAGWSYLSALRDNGLIAAGGNSSVITRVETGERDVGVVLLENLLKAARSGSPAVPVFPTDGAIAVPGPIALTKDCNRPGAARAVYDLLLSEAGQRAMVRGRMYAALPGLPPPEGAPPLSDLVVRPWDAARLARVRAERSQLKARWLELLAGS